MFGRAINGVAGTTGSAPGTGNFTPNGAAAQSRPWSVVDNAWFGVVRFVDTGGVESLEYCYWNGVTLSRSATQRFWSTSGSHLSLTAAAIAILVADGSELTPNPGLAPVAIAQANNNATTIALIGTPTTIVASGTASAQAVSSNPTNLREAKVRVRYSSATTASAQAGWAWAPFQVFRNTAQGIGGCDFLTQFSIVSLPTAPILYCGLGSGSTGEPGGNGNNLISFTKDSTDTNIQFSMSNGFNSTIKQDTGIVLAANGVYLSRVWWGPGTTTVHGLLIRVDTGQIWYGTATPNNPISNALTARCLVGLNATNTGTAAIIEMSRLYYRGGG